MHNFLIERLADGSNPPILCNVWYAYVLTLSQTFATLLEFILAVRGKLNFSVGRYISVGQSLQYMLCITDPGE